MKIFDLTLAVSLVVGFSTAASAQNFVRDYFVDEPQTYLPSDFTERGWIYRMHAGFEGWFRDCDDDASLRYSPYIYWRERNPICDRGPAIQPLAHLGSQIHDGIQGVADGAGCCASYCRCGGCYARLVPTLILGATTRRGGGCCDSQSFAHSTVSEIPLEFPMPSPVPVEEPSMDETIEPETGDNAGQQNIGSSVMAMLRKEPSAVPFELEDLRVPDMLSGIRFADYQQRRGRSINLHAPGESVTGVLHAVPQAPSSIVEAARPTPARLNDSVPAAVTADRQSTSGTQSSRRRY